MYGRELGSFRKGIKRSKGQGVRRGWADYGCIIEFGFGV